MLITAERPTALQIASRAWTSLFQALRQMAPLFLCCLLLQSALVVFGIWLLYQNPWIDWTHRASDWLPGFWTPIPITAALRDILTLFFIAPLAVAVHRSILLGEVPKTPFFLNRTTLRFTAWLLVFEFASLFGAALSPWTATAIGWLFNLGYAVVACWVLLAFPAIAVGESAKTGRLATAIRRARGNFWLIAGALLLTIFVLIALSRGFDIAYDAFMRDFLRNQQFHFPGGLTSFPGISWIYMLLSNCIQLAMVALSAATASWLYSYAAYRTVS